MAGAATVVAAPVFAQAPKAPGAPGGAAGEVEVVAVRSKEVKDSGGDAWLEATIELSVKATAPGQNYVDRVAVAFSMATERRSPEKGYTFYRARAEAAALKSGRAFFRFYLPPEVVERDGVSDLKTFLVEITAAGRAMPLTRDKFSTSTIPNESSLNSFKTRVTAEAPANDGILLPQYLTPFAQSYARETPSFVRLERMP